MILRQLFVPCYSIPKAVRRALANRKETATLRLREERSKPARLWGGDQREAISRFPRSSPAFSRQLASESFLAPDSSKGCPLLRWVGSPPKILAAFQRSSVYVTKILLLPKTLLYCVAPIWNVSTQLGPFLYAKSDQNNGKGIWKQCHVQIDRLTIAISYGDIGPYTIHRSTPPTASANMQFEDADEEEPPQTGVQMR